MSKGATVAGSSITGNVIGALTFGATVYFGLRSDSTPITGGAPMISSGHPWLLVVVGSLALFLLLPSWLTLIQHFWPTKTEEPEWWVPFRPASNWASYPFQQRWNQTYTRQTVDLDGYDYINCTFDNVTFRYNGIAPFSLRNPRIIQEGPMIVTTANNVVAQALSVAAICHQAMGGTAEIRVQPT